MSGRVYFISDTHFGHKNIIDYCGRPYNCVEEMNKDIIKRWNSVVKNDDVVYHLGDFGFGSKEEVAAIVSQLNGIKKLILGNHDRWRPQIYRDMGFKEVYDRPIILENFWILSHAPIEGLMGKQSPFVNIYGHIHNDERYGTYAASGVCVCVERHPVPVLFDNIKIMVSTLREEEVEEDIIGDINNG